MKDPLSIRPDGRDESGRFAKGNPGGPGNPYARRVAEIRSTLLSAVSDEDLRQIALSLVEKAKGGDVMAAREILDRMMGKAKTTLAVESEAAEYTPEEIRERLNRLVGENPGLRAMLLNTVNNYLPSSDGGDPPTGG